jgi:glutamate N-acetyltransferase/amino-acid N-acetyltransferase
MTTDTRSKEIFLEKRIGGARVAVAGFAKGSGMIAPNMGTMLAFLATDARVSPGELQSIFSEAVDDTFNMVSVDGDTSTNDMAMIFSTGARDIGGQLDALARLIADACAELAKMIAADGEGAEKLIAIRVRGAADRAQARRIAMNVVGSPLVKTAIHGADPNWGRIIAAAGKDPAVEIDPDRLVLTLQGIAVFRRGAPVAESLKPCAERLREKTIDIDLKLNQGDGRARAWGCDLTHGYIDINTQYS